MSVDDRIAKIERKVDVSAEDITVLIKDTRTVYREIRRVERTANQAIRLMNLMGAAIPGISLLGVIAPYAFAAMFIMNISMMVMQQITKMQEEQAARDREILRQELRHELVIQVKGEVEARRREQYRTVVP